VTACCVSSDGGSGYPRHCVMALPDAGLALAEAK